jgi:hypothetical protein
MVKNDSSQSEEVKRFDTELKEMTHELNNMLNLNEDLASNIEAKDVEICNLEERLRSLRETQSADLEQWDLEQVSIRDTSMCDVNVSREKVRKLKLFKERVTNISNENDNLKELIQSATTQLNANRINHNLEMHERNLSMAQTRRDLENKLKRDLIKMDITYQKEAFDLLPVSKKNAMFENAKLKDEVSLQGVGMANLGTRHERQMYAYEACKEYADMVTAKCDRSRRQLCKLHAKKFELTKVKTVSEDKASLLLEKKNVLIEKLSQYAEVQKIALDKQACWKSIDQENVTIEMWKERFMLYQKLHSEIKPTSSSELLGIQIHAI